MRRSKELRVEPRSFLTTEAFIFPFYGQNPANLSFGSGFLWTFRQNPASGNQKIRRRMLRQGCIKLGWERWRLAGLSKADLAGRMPALPAELDAALILRSCDQVGEPPLFHHGVAGDLCLAYFATIVTLNRPMTEDSPSQSRQCLRRRLWEPARLTRN